MRLPAVAIQGLLQSLEESLLVLILRSRALLAITAVHTEFDQDLGDGLEQKVTLRSGLNVALAFSSPTKVKTFVVVVHLLDAFCIHRKVPNRNLASDHTGIRTHLSKMALCKSSSETFEPSLTPESRLMIPSSPSAVANAYPTDLSASHDLEHLALLLETILSILQSTVRCTAKEKQCTHPSRGHSQEACPGGSTKGAPPSHQ